MAGKANNRHNFTTILHRLVAAETEKSHHLAVVSLALMSFILLSMTLQLLFIGRLGIATEFVIAVLGILGLMYFSSRTIYYRVGIYFGLIAAFVFALAVIATYQSPISTIMLLGPVLISTLLLQLRSVLRVTALVMICHYFVGTQISGEPYETGIIAFFSFMTGTILVIQMYLRNRSQTELHDAALRHLALFEQTNDAVFILDLNGYHLQVNRRAADMLGYHPDEMVGLSFRDIVVPDQHDQSSGVRQRLIAGERVTPYERVFRRRDGTTLPTEVNVQIVYDESGSPVHIQSIIRDITERKDMEDALRQSEARLRAMIEAIPDIMFRNRADGTYLDYHAPNPDLLIVPPEVFLGRTITEVLEKDLAQEQMASIQQAIETGQMTLHEFEIPLHGQNRHFEVRIVPAGDDEVLSISRDVTELWQTRRERDAAHARLEFSVDTARIAWWEMDIATGRVEFDARKVLMAGYDPDQFTDVTYQDFTALVHPEDYPGMMQAMRDLLDGDAEIYAADYRMRKATGDWIWFHDRGELVVEDDGRQYVRGFVIDITEREQAQQREIELALERERVNLLSLFVQNTAHEFRTPLGIINTSAYLMSKSDDPAKRAQRAGKIEEQVELLNHLIEMLLLMVRLESTQTLKREPVDIHTIFSSVCRNLVMIYGEKPQLICKDQETSLMVTGDGHYLTDAVEQILDNAYRFTPAEGTITVAVGSADGQVWLAVSDTGPGIPADLLPHIFETFWRQDEAHTTPGFGLGLSIARKIVQAHGGDIEVESVFGEGTTFRIVLPALSDANPPPIDHFDSAPDTV